MANIEREDDEFDPKFILLKEEYFSSRLYTPIIAKCFACGGQVSITGTPFVYSTWARDCAESITHVLKLDPSYVSVLQASNYCTSCLFYVREVNFLYRSINCLQGRLKTFCTRFIKGFKNKYDLLHALPKIEIEDPETSDHKNGFSNGSYSDLLHECLSPLQPPHIDEVENEIIDFVPLSDTFTTPEQHLAQRLIRKKNRARIIWKESRSKKKLLNKKVLLVKIVKNLQPELKCLFPHCSFKYPERRPKLYEIHCLKEHEMEVQYDRNIDSSEPIPSDTRVVCLPRTKTKLLKKPDKLEKESRRQVRSKVKIAPISCTIEGCKFSHQSRQQVEIHIRKVHEGDPMPHHCSYCPLKFLIKNHFLRHVREAHPQEISNMGEENIECHHCAFMFTSRNELDYQSHVQLHAERETRNQKFSCVLPECEKIFMNTFDLRKHVLSQHEVLGFTRCEFCSKAIKGRERRLEEHVRNYHYGELNPFKCKVCHFPAKGEEELQVHRQIHQEAKYICKECGRAFRWKPQYKTHVISHTPRENWPFKCTFSGCEKRFYLSGRLKTHEETHSSVCSYICDQCTKAYKTRKALHQHFRLVHKKIQSTEFIAHVNA